MFGSLLQKLNELAHLPKEYIDDGWFNIRVIFDRITGDKLVFILYIIATIYILFKVKEKDKEGKPKAFFIVYPILLGLVVCCPIVYYVISGYLKDVYFRLFWLFPAGIAIAYAGVDLIYSFSKKYVRIATFIGCITVIMCCGTFIYNENNFIKVHNLYKIPDEAKWVTDIIMQDESTDKYVLAVPEVVPYIRQVNSDIKLVYGRDVTEMYDSWWPNLIKTGDARTLLPNCKNHNVRYIVLYNNVELNALTYRYGYHILAQTYSYDVYKYKE